MGSEIYLYATTGVHPVVARVGVQSQPVVDQKFNLVFDMSKAHFFDPDTEETIVTV
jgi:multiple sugar transport system ATP-binding protein